MSSVAPANPALSDLLQTLSNISSPVLSSPSVVSALQNASPADIVKLSAAAAQLEEVDSIFGGAENPNNVNPGLSTFNSLETALTGSAYSAAAGTPGSSTSPSSTLPADQLASYQNSVQAAEADALLGYGSPSSTSSSLFSYLG